LGEAKKRHLAKILLLVTADVIAFATTNLDDLFVLPAFLSKPEHDPGAVVLGQFLGIGSIVAPSLRHFADIIADSKAPERPHRHRATRAGFQKSRRAPAGACRVWRPRRRRSQEFRAIRQTPMNAQ